MEDLTECRSPVLARNFHLHLTSRSLELHKTPGRKELHSLWTERHYLTVSRPQRLFDVRATCSSPCWPLTDSCSQTPLEVPSFKETVLLFPSTYTAVTTSLCPRPERIRILRMAHRDADSFSHPLGLKSGCVKETGRNRALSQSYASLGTSGP